MDDLLELQEETRDVILKGLNSDKKQRCQQAVAIEELKVKNI
jgi:hypothetical protein